MLYQTTDFLNMVRDHIGESRTRGTILNSVVLDYVNSAQNKVASKMMAIRKDFMLTYQDVNLNGGFSYSLPVGVDGIAFVEDITSGEDSPSEVSNSWFEERFLYVQDRAGTTGSRGYTINRNRLFLPAHDNSGILRVWYPIIPKGLGYFTATSGTATTVTAPASLTAGTLITAVNNYYVGMFLTTDSGQFREVTSYVGSTRTFTVSDWDSTPTGTSIISLSSPIWPRFQDLIHLEAGRMFRSDLDLPTQEISIEIKDHYSIMENILRKYVSQTRTHVRKVAH